MVPLGVELVLVVFSALHVDKLNKVNAGHDVAVGGIFPELGET